MLLLVESIGEKYKNCGYRGLSNLFQEENLQDMTFKVSFFKKKKLFFQIKIDLKVAHRPQTEIGSSKVKLNSEIKSY